MKKIYKTCLVMIFAVSALFSGAVSAHNESSAETLDAYNSVKMATDQLLKKLLEVQPLYVSDQVAFFREVDSSLATFIDFEGFSKGVMAKYYRKATPAQRLAFSAKFRKSLIETYAKALVSFNNQRVDVLKPTVKQKKPDRAKIVLNVYAEDGTVYDINYSLRLIDGSWKLRNLQINGINLGLQFRAQFKAAMDKHRQDIDAVVENWQVDD